MGNDDKIMVMWRSWPKASVIILCAALLLLMPVHGAEGLLSSCLISAFAQDETGSAPAFPGTLPGTEPGEEPVFDRQTGFDHASGVDIYSCDEGYSYIDVHDDGSYLIVPEEGAVPEDLPSDVTVIRRCPQRIYNAATAVMSLINACGGLSSVRFSSLKEEDWYLPEAREAMESRDMVYAGKYSTPDYELLLSSGCDLAVESTMIYHTPKVKEMLERIGIPVFVDRSSYEEHPLGRCEWIKVYGAILGKEEEAGEFFEEQKELLKGLEGFENTDKSVAFFYVHSDGSVVVRRADDLIPKMIGMAGGRYALSDMEALNNTMRSSVSITMEAFYDAAVNADHLIYNSSIDEPLGSAAELIEKSPVFADFKAVKENNVWCSGPYLYQAADRPAQFILDIRNMLTEGNEEKMTFLTHVD